MGSTPFSSTKSREITHYYRTMNEFHYENGQVKVYGNSFEIGSNLIGFFLANIPFLILGPGKIWRDLGPKAARAQTNAEKLLQIGGMNELAAL